MLMHPTLDKLQTLKLSGMYHALVEQLQMADIAALSFEERFGLLVDREITECDNRRLTTRLRQANSGRRPASKILTIGIPAAWTRR